MRESIRGTIESSSRKTYEDSDKEKVVSEPGRFLIESYWLPDYNGNFRRPAELGLKDLPDTFRRDDSIATQLGMQSDTIQKLADELGLPKHVMAELSSIPPDELEDFIRSRRKVSTKSDDYIDSHETYPEEVESAFSQARHQPENTRFDILSDLQSYSGDLGKRGKHESSLIRGRPYIIRRRQVPKSPQIRQYMMSTYGGRCQMGGQSFMTIDRHLYFETIPLVNRIHLGEWANRPGNYLCLNAENAARWQRGPISTEDHILEQILNADLENPMLVVMLCSDQVIIRYAPDHFADLRKMVDASL